MFHIKVAGMFMICLHTEFHMSSCSASFIIVVKLRAVQYSASWCSSSEDRRAVFCV
jgi:hypothetical protein